MKLRRFIARAIAQSSIVLRISGWSKKRGYPDHAAGRARLAATAASGAIITLRVTTAPTMRTAAVAREFERWRIRDPDADDRSIDIAMFVGIAAYDCPNIEAV